MRKAILMLLTLALVAPLGAFAELGAGDLVTTVALDARHQEARMTQATKVYHVPIVGPSFTGDFHGFPLTGGLYAVPDEADPLKRAQREAAAENILVRFYGAVAGPWPDDGTGEGDAGDGGGLGEGDGSNADGAATTPTAGASGKPPAKAGGKRGKG